MPRYDGQHYDPPAPVAVVTLQNLAADRTVADVELLIDTGADVTLLPKDAVARLGIPAKLDEQYELIGFDGARSSADVIDLQMLFCGKAFRGRYLLTDATSGILGRDVLASQRLLLDGPMKEWLESQSPSDKR